MRVRHLAMSLVAGVFIAACGDEPETSGTQQQRWTSQEQLHRQEPPPTGGQARVGPEQRAEEFFQALQSEQPEQAAKMISRESRQAAGTNLEQSLQQWAIGAAGAREDIQVVDSLQQGDFALVRARFPASAGDPTQPELRPVIMFREEGEWKVVWDLLGMLPEQVAQTDPQTANRLDPLYRWYDNQQRTSVSRRQQQGGDQQGAQAPQGSQQQQGAASDQQSSQQQQQGAQAQQDSNAQTGQQTGATPAQPSS